MQENTILLIYCFVIILLFVWSSRKKNLERTYDKIKEKEYIWFWFDLFKKERSEENFITLFKYLSLFVISIMGLSIMYMIYVWINK